MMTAGIVQHEDGTDRKEGEQTLLQKRLEIEPFDRPELLEYRYHTR